jgi:hypothetical protein
MWYTLWNDIFDAHRDNRKRFVVRAEEKLTAIPHYHIELRLSNTILYSWTADADPLIYGGKFASLSGIVGNWGSTLLSLTW